MNKRICISVLIVVCIMALGITEEAFAQENYFKSLDYPWPVEYQQTETGARVAYIDEGRGSPALILIHGLGSYIPSWKQNIPLLSKHRRVIALDLPGFGKSSKQAEHYSISFFARTVKQLQDSLGIDKAVWIGHSMGAQIAMLGVLKFPNYISKLILISPAGFEQFTDREVAMMNNFITPESIMATPDSVIRRTFKLTFYDFPEEAQFMIEDRIAMRGAKHFERYARAYNQSVAAMLQEPVFKRLDSIQAPTLIIFGRQDELIPNKLLHPNLTVEEVAKKGAAKIPNSKLLLIDKAGHFVHFEKAKKVNQAIIDFIE